MITAQLFDNLQRWVDGRPFMVVFLFAVAGWVLLIVSMMLHIGQVPFTGDLVPAAVVAGQAPEVAGLQVTAKDVGYIGALNWSLFGGIILPVIVLFCIRMRSRMEPTLAELARDGLVRDTTNFKRIAAEDLIARWRVDRRINGFIPTTVFVLVLGFIGWDFATAVVGPILNPLPARALMLSSATYEYDWSVACRMRLDPAVSCAANLAFDAVAYFVVAGLGVAFVFGCMVEGALFVAFACGYTPSAPGRADEAHLPTNWELVAAPLHENDRLCGFRAFEPYFTSLILAALTILPALLFMILQNTYLRHPTSSDLTSFLQEDFQATFTVVADATSKLDIGKALAALFKSSTGNALLANPQTALGILVFVFVVLASLGASWGVLRVGARSARDAAAENLAALAQETGLSEPVLQGRLDKMEFWPLGWITWRGATTIVVFMSLAIISYRLVFLPVVVAIVLLIWTTLKMLRPGAGAAGPATPGA